MSDSIKSKLSTILRITSIAMLAVSLARLLSGERIDMYYMIASGNWMIDHKSIETFNVTSPVPMPVENQNWLWCVIYALLWRIGQTLPFDLIPILAFHAIIVTTLWALCAHAAYCLTKNRDIAYLSQILLIANNDYIWEIRSSSMAMIIGIATFWLLTEIAEGERPLSHAVIVCALAVLHLNIQAAIALIDVAIAVFVAVTSTVRGRPRTRYVYVVCAIMLLLTLTANPYPNIVLHQMTAVESAKLFYPPELRSILIRPNYAINLVTFTVVYFHCLKSHERSKTWPGTALLILGILMSIYASRLIVYATLFTLFALWSIDGVPIEPADEHATDRRVTALALCTACVATQVFICVLCLVGSTTKLMYGTAPKDYLTTNANIEPTAFDLRDLRSIPDDNSSVLDLNLNFGSYLSMRGHTVAITSRWEVWDKPVGDSESWLADYMETLTEDVGIYGAIGDVTWDYVLIPKTSPNKTLVKDLDESEHYTKIDETKNVMVWAHR